MKAPSPGLLLIAGGALAAIGVAFGWLPRSAPVSLVVAGLLLLGWQGWRRP